MRAFISGIVFTLVVAGIAGYLETWMARTSSPSPIAKGLYQKPPQLATHGVEDDPEGESFWKIQHGIRLAGMPSFAAS